MLLQVDAHPAGWFLLLVPLELLVQLCGPAAIAPAHKAVIAVARLTASMLLWIHPQAASIRCFKLAENMEKKGGQAGSDNAVQGKNVFR